MLMFFIDKEELPKVKSAVDEKEFWHGILVPKTHSTQFVMFDNEGQVIFSNIDNVEKPFDFEAAFAHGLPVKVWLPSVVYVPPVRLDPELEELERALLEVEEQERLELEKKNAALAIKPLSSWLDFKNYNRDKLISTVAGLAFGVMMATAFLRDQVKQGNEITSSMLSVTIVMHGFTALIFGWGIYKYAKRLKGARSRA
ncbi:MAG: hypothetical protein EOP06_20435 [Proteobacteria bacterium]|nr:MAG: hypothetical protein EOP06_20435 [Pseudomonadota bacterium]